MKNIEEINRSNLNKIIAERKHPDFFPGDIVKVGVRITEGKRDRIQYFEGVCIAKKSRDINSSFTVRKISFGEGVERTFALYSPIVDTIKVVRSGKVRRAKLYYLRDRTGKSARIAEKIKKTIGIDLETKINEVTEENVMPSTEPQTEAPKEEVKAEAPKEEAPKEEAPKVEEKVEAPVIKKIEPQAPKTKKAVAKPKTKKTVAKAKPTTTKSKKASTKKTTTRKKSTRTKSTKKA